MPAIKELHAAIQALQKATEAKLGEVNRGLQQLEHRVNQGDQAVTAHLGKQTEGNQTLAAETQNLDARLKVIEAQQAPLASRVQGAEDAALECRTLKMNIESRIPQIEAQLQKLVADLHHLSAKGSAP